jgi:hypothetical protein
MRNFALILCFFGIAAPLHASYRVYQLKLEYFDAYGKKERERIEISTLDAVQYENYYGGYSVVRAVMLDTWYCPGDTSFRKSCEKPGTKTTESSVPTRGPLSTNPKRRALPVAVPGGLPYHLQPVIP